MQMHRLTFGSVKSVIAKVLNLCETDTERILSYVNRACERLLNEGNWVGAMARYRVCVDSGCVTWPRSLETIWAFALCNTPMPIMSPWWEFLGNGTYLQDNECASGWGCGTMLIPRDETASFSNVIGSNKKLAIYCDADEDPTAAIILHYYDNNAQWVRTQSGGDWIDGERIVFGAAGTYAYTTKYCMANGYVRAIKPVTKGTVRLYEFNTTNSTYRALAYYEPDETIPVYTRSQIPGLSISESEDCAKRSVTVMAKKRFIPVAKDNDFLPISHAEAIRMAVQSIWKSENNMPAEASIYMNGGIDLITRNRIEGAIPLLQAQLRHFRGGGAITPIKMVNASTFGAGGILQLT
jgi:hypothetical protein